MLRHSSAEGVASSESKSNCVIFIAIFLRMPSVWWLLMALLAFAPSTGLGGDDQRAGVVGRGAGTNQSNHHQPRREGQKKKDPACF